VKLGDYVRCDGVALAGLVRTGEVGPEVLRAVAAAARVEPRLNAVVEWYESPDAVRSGGPLEGVPFLRKDLGITEAGRLLEMGSRMAEGFRPASEAVLTDRFKAAGLQVLGRSATPEFGICGTTEPEARGPTRNPWDPERSAGGSSGGAGAAVATGVVPIAHGSDGGGSIRIPAAACGVVGLKVSRGRVSAGREAGESILGLSVDFVLTRTVRDTAAVLEAVSGPAPGDPFVIAGPQHPSDAPLPPLRIAWTDGERWPGRPPVDPEVSAATQEVAGVLADLGHRVEEAAPDYDWEEYLAVMTDAFALATASVVRSLSAETGRPVSAEFLEPLTMANVEHAARLSSLEVHDLESRANGIRRRVGDLFTGCDLLVCPTLARPAAPLGTRWGLDPGLSAYEWTVQQEDWIPFTAVFNITGQPAMSLPLGHSAAGLPIGVQLVARSGREDLLLAAAGLLEEALPWADRIPPIHAASVEGSGPAQSG
jgi:amidase